VAASTTPRKRAPAKKTTRAAAAPLAARVDDAELERLQAEVDEALAHDDSPVGPDGEIRPVVVGKKGKSGPEMVHIFTIADVDYFIPKHPSPAVMIKFMREARDRRVGRDAAVQNAMITLLGSEALDALAESPDTDEEDVAKVFTIVAHILFGSLKRMRAASDPS